jgi:two-component system cell cycle sensor histidine kinase/response regulator CckA
MVDAFTQKESMAPRDLTTLQRDPLLQAIPDLVVRIDPQLRFVEAHVGVLARPLVPPEEFIGQRVDEVLPPHLASMISDACAEVLATAEPGSLRYELEQDPGELRQFEARFVSDGQGGILCMIRDITEIVEARSESARLRAAIDQTDDVVLITDPAGTITYVNPAFTQVTGYTAAEAIGANPRILKSGEQDDASYREIWDRISSGRTWTGRFINRCKDGSLFTEQATISPVHDALGTIVNYVSVKRDISEQLQLEQDRADLEQQMRQAQKMEALGQLAGGVAHDFANIIAAIRGSAELALPTAVEPSLRESLDDVLAASDKATALTRQLLTFARRGELAPQVVDLGQSIDGMRSMLQRLIGRAIELEIATAPCLLLADASQLQQVVLNLALNARDAMPQGGRLVIEAAEAALDETACAAHPQLSPGRYAALAVSDTGQGISAEVRERMFEPFFSTKKRDQGSGLGLSTVFGIVRQSGGQILVYSEPGRGTTIRVYFPSAGETLPDAPAAEPTGATVAAGAPGRGETVLVAEDDALVRRTVVGVLGRAGYRVLSAGSGEEALAMANAHVGAIALLFTDVIMGGLSGPELAELLREARPETKVLFTSGYSREMATRAGLAEGAALVEKPFSASGLAARIRDVIDR